jgi:hypothetical protein
MTQTFEKSGYYARFRQHRQGRPSLNAGEQIGHLGCDRKRAATRSLDGLAKRAAPRAAREVAVHVARQDARVLAVGHRGDRVLALIAGHVV